MLKLCIIDLFRSNYMQISSIDYIYEYVFFSILHNYSIKIGQSSISIAFLHSRRVLKTTNMKGHNIKIVLLYGIFDAPLTKVFSLARAVSASLRARLGSPSRR